MRLTRRDAMRASVIGGVTIGGAVAVSEQVTDPTNESQRSDVTETDLLTLKAIAEVVYPAEVTITTGFLRAYLNRLSEDRQSMMSQTIIEVNEFSRSRVGSPYFEIKSTQIREALLRTMGVDRVQSKPTGTIPERVKYHLVNSLLYVLYTSPKGSQLVGIENPIGYPGGFATYRR